MKNKIKLNFTCICLSFITNSLIAQRVQQIDLSNNPFYPIPFSYTTNHMNLLGNVKKVTDFWKSEFDNSYNLIQYEFNQNGELQKQTNSRNNQIEKVTTYRDTVFSISPLGVSIIEESIFKGNYSKSKFSYFNKKPTIKTIYGGNNNSTQIETISYSHNSKGLLIEEKSDINNIYTKYTYDELDHLIKSEDYATYKFNQYVNELTQWRDYTYSKENDYLTVNIWYRFKSGTDFKIVEVYNKNGLLVKKNNEFDKKEYIYQYTFDKNNNWTKKEEKVINIKSGTEIINTKYRTLEYY